MRIAEINSSNYGSTGTIMLGISDMLRKNGHEVLVCYPATKRNLSKKVDGSYIIGNRIGRNIALHLSKIFGCDDLLYVAATRNLVRRLKQFGPQAVHLHLLHGWYLNIPVLFNYFKENNIKIVWTMHDCWAVTGHCPYFDMPNCRKWMGECSGCLRLNEYPDSLFDNSRRMHNVKKNNFLGLKDLTIVTPSRWLAGVMKQSFMRGYALKVINNGIDLSVFKPRESDFRRRHGFKDKKVVLGVAFGWGVRKGLDIFIRLAEELDDTYRIVLVGTDDRIAGVLPDGILSIRRTKDKSELAGIYAAADVFVNPTREENFPTVNIEALACGTPVITFDTGGSPEIIDDTCGVVVEKDNFVQLLNSIVQTCTQKPFTAEQCIHRASVLSDTAMLADYMRCFNE